MYICPDVSSFDIEGWQVISSVHNGSHLTASVSLSQSKIDEYNLDPETVTGMIQRTVINSS